jgi:hypothetical protein
MASGTRFEWATELAQAVLYRSTARDAPYHGKTLQYADYIPQEPCSGANGV